MLESAVFGMRFDLANLPTDTATLYQIIAAQAAEGEAREAELAAAKSDLTILWRRRWRIDLVRATFRRVSIRNPQGLPSNSGMPRDLSLPFPPTRAGAPQKAYSRDRRDTDAVWLSPHHRAAAP